MHQSLIHEVMAQETTTNHLLTCEACIQSLKQELNALHYPEVFDGVKVSYAKGYCPVLSIAKEPVASSSAPAPPTVTLVANKSKEKETAPTIASKPPFYPFSGIPHCYAPPAQKNFATPDKCQDAAYYTMLPIYNIEQTKAVFDRVLCRQR